MADDRLRLHTTCRSSSSLEHDLARLRAPRIGDGGLQADVPACSRRAARSARMASSARTRPSFLVRRALMPCRTQTSSSASFLSNRPAPPPRSRAPLPSAAGYVCVVAGPGRQPSAIELDDARGEALEEGAVVRDEHDRAGVARQEIFEPGDGVDVEVVGRLIEEQQVWLPDQRARQQDAAAPAARQRVDDGVAREMQSRQDEIDVVFADPGLVFGVAMGMAFGDDVEDRAAGGKRDVLFQPRDADARLAPDRAGVGQAPRR